MLVQDSAFAHALLVSVRSGVIAVDGAGAIAALSAEGARLLGIPSRLGEPASQALAGQPEVLAQLEAARRGQAAARAELALRGPAGASRTIGFSTLAVAGGGAAMFFRDLTPIERHSEQERLRSRLAALGQMAAGLAHELRNPLAAIELLAGLIGRAAVDDPEQKRLASEISTEVQSLAATIDACLTWVRPEPAQRAPFDPALLIAEALRRARARLPFEGEVEIDVDPRAEAVGDFVQLRGALENLVANALQAMAAHPRAEGHRLALRAAPLESGERGLSLFVCDTGPGVSTELRERIFFPFFTTRAGGSGIGLAWVQKVAAGHGGSVGLTDRPGGGACFSLHVPAEVLA